MQVNSLDYDTGCEFFGCWYFRPIKTGTVVNAVDPFGFTVLSVLLKLETQSQFHALSRDHLRYFASQNNCDSRARSEISTYAHEISVALRDARPLPSVNVDASFALVSVRKAYCESCSCVVNHVGHALRCVAVPSTQSHVQVDKVRRLAWLGDALHTFDVRHSLLLKDVAASELQSKAQSFLTAASQSHWYSILSSGVPQDSLVLPLGPSLRQRSDAFEASYRGEFRLQYCVHALESEPVDPALAFARMSTDFVNLF